MPNENLQIYQANPLIKNWKKLNDVSISFQSTIYTDHYPSFDFTLESVFFYFLIFLVKHGGQELEEESSDNHESPSDVSDTEEDVDKKSQHLLQKLKPIESSDLSKTVDEPDGWRNEQHLKHKLVDTPKQLVTFNLSSVASDEPYKSILSSLPSSKANNTWLNESEQEKKVESEIKKEFNDVSKLQEDQKKCMKRAKDLLKAAFSESESDSEDSDTEGNIPNTKDNDRGISDDDVTLS